MNSSNTQSRLIHHFGGRFVILSTKFGSHFAEDTLERYVLGQLSEDLANSLEEHLFVCDICRSRLEEAEDFVRATAAASAELQKPQARKSFWSQFSWLWTMPKPVFAGALAALLLAFLIPYSRNFGGGSISEVALHTTRGVEQNSLPVARAGRVSLAINVSELPAQPRYHLELVDANGTGIWSGDESPNDQTIHAAVPKKLGRGSYWVRIYGASGNTPLREYGLEVR